MVGRIGSYKATRDFERGVLWCAARLVEIYDEPTMASELLRESGADPSLSDRVDAPYIKIAMENTP